jgi:hypothetical protein
MIDFIAISFFSFPIALSFALENDSSKENGNAVFLCSSFYLVYLILIAIFFNH